MNEKQKRILTTFVVFIFIYMFTPLLVASKSYDIYIDAMRVLGAIIGAGCYWIGICREK